ncbi:MAG: Lon protease family protein [Candidatus Dasytiphilus stammeri]
MNTKLKWQELQPDLSKFKNFFSSSFNLHLTDSNFFEMIQPRLNNGLNLLEHSNNRFPLMLVKYDEHINYFSIINDSLNKKKKDKKLYGGHYQVNGNKISWQKASSINDNFASHGDMISADWTNTEELFGTVRIFNKIITLVPGLVHRANGGILVLNLRTVVSKPNIWFRLKNILMQKRFDWYSFTKKPFPVNIPSMPLFFKLILIGTRDLLKIFNYMEPKLTKLSIYSEVEDELYILNEKHLFIWCQWVTKIALYNNKNIRINADLWPVLFNEAVRFTGNQQFLPLCPCWIESQICAATQYCNSAELDGKSLQRAISAREWRNNYLPMRLRDEFLFGQTIIQTEGMVIGQINGISVIELEGYPFNFGEPLRISCVIHKGDGEIMDIERKVDLCGNIHYKGIMIIQSWLNSVLQIDQPLPFSASLVFEQNYSKIDGDSASLAVLCVVISALANQPITQEIAVTGSIDQFGNVQSVGKINEKIEGFFNICMPRTLTGKQGVIIPASNLRQLCLTPIIIDAVRNGKFNIWTVKNVQEAIELLTAMKWLATKDNEMSVLQKIKERITQNNSTVTNKNYQNNCKWKKWFKWCF